MTEQFSPAPNRWNPLNLTQIHPLKFARQAGKTAQRPENVVMCAAQIIIGERSADAQARRSAKGEKGRM